METSNFYSQLPTDSQIQSYEKYVNSSIDHLNKGRDYRMENYFNCVDDYSWGGPCDKAADQAESRLRNNLKCLKEQNGKAQIEQFEIDVLTDLDGKIVSERLVNGRFGYCWIIGGDDNVTFVGEAKKAKTYEKKGYKLMTRVYEVEFYYTIKETKKGDVIPVSRILSEKIIDKNWNIEKGYGGCNLTQTYVPFPLWIAQRN